MWMCLLSGSHFSQSFVSSLGLDFSKVFHSYHSRSLSVDPSPHTHTHLRLSNIITFFGIKKSYLSYIFYIFTLGVLSGFSLKIK